MNEIERKEKQGLAWNGKPICSTDAEIMAILAGMFAAFPQTKADENTVAAYIMMLRDIDPQTLASAVIHVMSTAEFLPTVASIRKHIEEERPAPGPRNDVDPHKLKDIPTQFYRLPEEEDKRQRMARLRMTRDWGKYYA